MTVRMLALMLVAGMGLTAVAAPPSPGQGVWSQATTLVTIRGKWLTLTEIRQLGTEKVPDRFLSYFSPAEARRLTAVALETGFDAILEARDRTNQGVPVPEKNLELRVEVKEKMFSGVAYYQPVIVVRLLKRPTPGVPPGKGVLPPMP